MWRLCRAAHRLREPSVVLQRGLNAWYQEKLFFTSKTCQRAMGCAKVAQKAPAPSPTSTPVTSMAARGCVRCVCVCSTTTYYY
jgi:hypothetical protein